MAVTFVTFHEFPFNLGNGAVDLDSHAFKAVLSNTAPSVANDDELADIVQIADGNGYTVGGLALTSVTFSEESAGTGRWIFTCADFQWNASGGSIGPFRYIVIYSDTSTGDKLVGYFDFGSSVTIPDGSFFLVDIGTGGIFKLGAGTVS